MLIKSLIKVLHDASKISIWEMHSYCGNSEDDCYYMDCEGCTDYEEHKESHTLFKGYASDIPIKLADRKIQSIGTTSIGKGKRYEAYLSVEVEKC